ncbi:MAG: hypothetical protein EOO40_02505 [Deltaproteobacteria bacterium]|nr:MAG: hypothetical protein EOO40_02505 [Deltaproteobacteria bacterium]
MIDSTYGHAMPHAFICPLSRRPFEQAVLAADGYTYERRSLDAWQLKHGNNLSPKTLQAMPPLPAVPNVVLMRTMREFDEQSSDCALPARRDDWQGNLLCPVGLDVMRRPVQLSTGADYGLENAVALLRAYPCCPTTRKMFTQQERAAAHQAPHTLPPDRAMQALADELSPPPHNRRASRFYPAAASSPRAVQVEFELQTFLQTDDWGGLLCLLDKLNRTGDAAAADVVQTCHDAAAAAFAQACAQLGAHLTARSLLNLVISPFAALTRPSRESIAVPLRNHRRLVKLYEVCDHAGLRLHDRLCVDAARQYIYTSDALIGRDRGISSVLNGYGLVFGTATWRLLATDASAGARMGAYVVGAYAPSALLKVIALAANRLTYPTASLPRRATARRAPQTWLHGQPTLHTAAKAITSGILFGGPVLLMTMKGVGSSWLERVASGFELVGVAVGLYLAQH